MSDDVMVTICCLAYNHEKYIRKTLESIVCQKTNFKYIALVHDDASTDGTAEIIKEFADKYPDIIKPVLQKENQLKKVGSVLSKILIPMVTSKYIAYCECDDYWCDEYKLQKQFDILENNPNVSMCAHRVQCVNEDGTENARTLPEPGYNINKTGLIPQDEFADLLFLKGGYPFHTSSYFHRRENVQNEFFKEFGGKLNGDQRISFSALYCGDAYYFNDTMSCRRVMVPGSYNQRIRQKSEEEIFKIRTNTLESCVQFDKLSEGVFNNKIIESVYGRIYNYLFNFDTKLVFNYFRQISKEFKFKWGISPTLSVRYLAMKYFPWLLSLYIGIRTKK